MSEDNGRALPRPAVRVASVDGVSSWEDRMADAAAERRVAAEAAEGARRAEEHARLVAANPALAGESEHVIDDGEHAGHRTHVHPWHGNGIVCQCGAPMGCFTVAVTGDEPEPEPCPVCIARGIPLGP